MVTVGDIIGGGFRLVRERIASVAVWALLYLAMNVAVVFAMRPFMLNMMAMQAATAAGTAPDPTAMLSGMGTAFGVYALLMIGLLVLYTAALRSAVRPQESAFAYLRLGMDELRMLAIGVIFMVGFFILYILLALVAGVIGAVVGFIARDAIFPVAVVLIVAVMCVLVFFQVRFSLAFALTMFRGKIMIGEAWQISKGRFWTLFGAYFVLGLIVFASAMVIFTISAGPYFAELSQSGFSPAGMQAAQHHQMERQFGTVTVLTVVGWVLGAMFGALWITLGAGAAGAAAIGLLGEDFADVGAIYE